MQDQEWLQGAFNILIGLLLWIEITESIVNPKTTTCKPGEIRSEMSEEAVGRRSIGKGYT